MTNFCSFENAQSLMTGIKDKLDEKVMSVNGITPDTDGNVSVSIPNVDILEMLEIEPYPSVGVLQVDNKDVIVAFGKSNIYPLENPDTIHKISIFDKDIALLQDIPEIPVTSVNGMTGDVVIDTYTLELEGGVKTVDGQSPDNTGNVPLLPLYKNGFEVRKTWPAYDKYDLDYDNDRRSYVNNNGSANIITSMGYGNIILINSFLSQRTNFIIPTTLSAYDTYGNYMKWVVYNATTNSEQIPINDTEVYIGDKIEVIFNKSERKVFVFGSNGKIKLLIALT